MTMVRPAYVTCPHCSEKRDVSGRYTSPRNAQLDAKWWHEEHRSGACVSHRSIADRSTHP